MIVVGAKGVCMLIDAELLSRHLRDANWIVFDCRHDLGDPSAGEMAYRAGHLPGAFFAPVDTALAGSKTGKNGRHPLPRAEDFAEFLNHHGVTAATRIVAYDSSGGMYAARLWWMARWIGLHTVSVLDGGWAKWIAGGNAVETSVPAPRARGDLVVRTDRSRLVDVEAVQAGVAAGGLQVLDARAANRFRGEVEPIDPVAGHIPGAWNRFHQANLNPDQTMRPAAELRREFETLLAGTPPERIAHQCGSGISACVNLLAMEHAGLTGSRLYVGSWSEWVADPRRPVARG